MDKRFDRLPDLMKKAIETLQKLHNTPDSLAMPAVLGVANLAAIPHYRINSIEFGIKPISLYIMCMLPTGMRKSTNYNEIVKGIARFEERRSDELVNEPVRFALDQKVFKAAEAAYIKDHESGWSTTPAPERPQPAETCEYRLEKGTVNGIIERIATQPFLGFFNDEGGEFFNSHSFQGGRDGKSRSIEMAGTLTKLWDGSNISKQTGMESVVLRNRAVNMMFFLQEETVRDFLNNPVFSAQGFVHRILITQSGSQPRQPMDLSDEAIAQKQQIRQQLDPFHDRIEQLIGQPMRRVPTRAFELDPQVLTLSTEARRVMQWGYNQHLTATDNELRNYAGFAERLFEHALRIAGTLAAFDQSVTVSEQHALAAWDLMDFFIEQRRNLELGVTTRNEAEVLSATKLLDWIKTNCFVGSKNELRRRVRWFGALTQDECDRTLASLVKDQELWLTVTVSANHRSTTIYSWQATDVSVDTDTARPGVKVDFVSTLSTLKT